MTAHPPTDDAIARLRAYCAAVGFDLDKSGILLERMRLAGESSKTFDDALRMAALAQRIFRYYERTRPAAAFTPVEQRTIVLGSLFSDIGKTGPASADAKGQRLIVDAFAVENVRDDKQSVAAFLRTYFPDDAEDRARRFTEMGIDLSMTLRQFWNLHSGWTLEIAEASGLPPEAVAAAATHHLLDDVNPKAIVGDDDRFTRTFGENVTFDRTEKLVILLDKYDAATRRGRLGHEGAMAWIRERIAKNARFNDDEELHRLVTDVDKVLGAPE